MAQQRRQPFQGMFGSSDSDPTNTTDWELIFGTWSDLGNQYQITPGRGMPLPREDIDYLEVYRGITFGRSLGSGGFGDVFEATVRDPPGTYACKIMSLSRFETSYTVYDAVQELVKEATLLNQLDHEHIIFMHKVVRVYDRNVQQQRFPQPIRLLIFMDLCNGALNQFIKDRQQLSERVSLRWLAQISDALRYLHNDRRMAHLDIKPHNILYRYEPNNNDRVMFKLADFGLAVTGQNVYNRVRGTGLYMAIEVSQGRLYDPYKADIWSLGKSFAESMAGYDPPPQRRRLPDDQLLLNRFVDDMRNYTPAISMRWHNVSELVAELVCAMTDPNPRTRCSIDDVCNHPRIAPLHNIIGTYFDHRSSPLD